MGSFSQLASDIDQAEAKATYDNEVLTLTQSKKTGGASRRLMVD
jgi:HSP20 family molecular chaperone IbpA